MAAGGNVQRDIAKARGEIHENGWNLVWIRRVGYLLRVVAIAGLLAAASLWTDEDASVPQTDSRWAVDDLFLLIRGMVP